MNDPVLWTVSVAGARVARVRRGAALFEAHRNCDETGRRRVLEGIFDQVVQHLSDAVRVAQDHHLVRCLDAERDATLLGAEQEACLCRTRQLTQVDRVALQRQVAGSMRLRYSRSSTSRRMRSASSPMMRPASRAPSAPRPCRRPAPRRSH